MAEDLYNARIQQAATSIASTWHAPPAEHPAMAEWLVAQYADVFVRQP
ncbi:hypothetical protein [Leucobacter luti]|nr:hypothetical protein [Leucobacter luti]QYM75605.1 hypothetical protein K1X41_13440 [Leucobacter luti]